MSTEATPEQIMRFLHQQANAPDASDALPEVQVEVREAQEKDVRSLRALYASSELQHVPTAQNALLFSPPVFGTQLALFLGGIYFTHAEEYWIAVPMCALQLVREPKASGAFKATIGSCQLSQRCHPPHAIVCSV